MRERGPAKSRKFAYLAVFGRFSNVIVTALSLFVVARVLPPDEFGRFSCVFAFTHFLSVLCVFGLDQAVHHRIGLAGNDQHARQSFAVNLELRALLSGYVVLCGLTSVLSFFLLSAFDEYLVDTPMNRFEMVVIVGFVIARSNILFFGEICRSIGNPVIANLFGGLSCGPLSTSLFLLTVSVFPIGGSGNWSEAMLCYLVSSVPAIVLVVWPVAALIGRERMNGKRFHGVSCAVTLCTLRECLPVFCVSALALITARSDVLILRGFQAASEVGIYEATRRASTYAAIPAAFYSVLCFVLPHALMSLVFGAEYSHGADELRTLVVGQLVFVLTGLCGTALVQTGNSRFLVYSSAIAALTTVGFGIVCAYSFGAMGMAIVVSTTVSLVNLANWWFLGSKVGIWTHLTCRLPLRRQLAKVLRKGSSRVC
jgi:O-antigen/teichoic acid export membrane protein